MYNTINLSTIPLGAYRTPSLRNVGLTAPYMHDGSIATLADVVWHYSQAIPDQDTPGTPAASFKALYLTDDEQSALVAFLESLSCDPPSGGRSGGAHAPLIDRGCGRSPRAPQGVSIFLTSSVKVGLAA